MWGEAQTVDAALEHLFAHSAQRRRRVSQREASIPHSLARIQTWATIKRGTSLFCNTKLGFTYQRRAPDLPVSDLILKKSAPHRAISTEQYQHRNNQTEGSTYYSPPGFFFCQQTILPNSSKGAGAACCAFWRAESGMLTPRAIMAGQYRLVLAVSTGIRAQGRVLWPSTL